ncbi:MAG: hypothetical protein JSV15_06335 [Candidatus Bathyarchaeota archaeon]|nr:MAG: hypothetical protein JSV15_06335 [Candidatus Bathyarchaeota archaeon]
MKEHERISSTDVLEDFYRSIFHTTSVWAKNHCNTTSGKRNFLSLYASTPTSNEVFKDYFTSKILQKTILNELYGRSKEKVNPKTTLK